MPQRVLVAVAWPYASGSRHLGHVAGAYLPADIVARYRRIKGDEVLMVSGSDIHGTPITVRARNEGISAEQVADTYHAEFLTNWDALEISWDLYTTTGTDTHRETVWDFFRTLADKGYLVRTPSDQFYDEEVGQFLPDRYVGGTCPACGYEDARGDQCDNCGRQLDPTDLLSPKSRLSGATPTMRETYHWFLELPKLAEQLEVWLEEREGWRPSVRNMALSMAKEGLVSRAITRDIDWGIDLPPEFEEEGKRIYVWFEAVIGYLSASIEWAKRFADDPDDWKRFWVGDEAESLYFVGKDNIVFHAIVWPAQLMAYGGLNLPTNVPANQYLTFSGEKGSASRGIGRSISWYTDRIDVDCLRYALAAELPEHSDSDFSHTVMASRINDELVAAWGNLVHRVCSMIEKSSGGVVEGTDAWTDADHELLAATDATLVEEAALLDRVELRAALREALAGARRVNGYLNVHEPWKLIKTDPDRARVVLSAALHAIAGLRTAFAPFLPRSTRRLGEILGLGEHVDGWSRPALPEGHRIASYEPLFNKLDVDELEADELEADDA